MTPARRFLRVLGPLVLLPGIAACAERPGSGVATSGQVDLTDAEGRQVRLAEPARRVVSLVPSATLTLDALGARDLLVARTDFDSTEWASALPTVGGGLHPSLEAIVAARPDLVVRFAGAQDPRTPDRLDDLGVPHLAIRPDRIQDVLEAVRLLGTATGREPAADSLIAAVRGELASVRTAVAGRGSVRVAYVLGGDPPWVAGPGTYLHELIEIAGGENVFGDLGSLYAAVSPEQFLAREIDVVLTSTPISLPGRLVADARLESVSRALELPGPSVADAAWEVARLLHGDVGR